MKKKDGSAQKEDATMVEACEDNDTCNAEGWLQDESEGSQNVATTQTWGYTAETPGPVTKRSLRKETRESAKRAKRSHGAMSNRASTSRTAAPILDESDKELTSSEHEFLASDDDHETEVSDNDIALDDDSCRN